MRRPAPYGLLPAPTVSDVCAMIGRMPNKRLPELPDTGRRYVENTIRARLASPGVEHNRRRPGGGRARLAIAALAIAALVAAIAWLAR